MLCKGMLLSSPSNSANLALHRQRHAFITSHLDYCNGLYTRCNAFVPQRLQCVQNCTARYILNALLRSPSLPLLRQLHWLPIESRICYKLCTESTATLLLHTWPNYVFPAVIVVFDRLLRETTCFREHIGTPSKPYRCHCCAIFTELFIRQYP